MHRIKCVGLKEKPIILKYSYKNMKKQIAIQKCRCFFINLLNKIYCWYNSGMGI